MARLTGVLFSPAKTFESIARKPGWDWLVPVVLVMAAFFVSQSATVTKIDVDDAVKTQMKFVDKMAKGQLPEEKRAEIEEQTRTSIVKGMSPVRRALNTLFVFIPVFFVPLVYFGITAAFGKKGKYLTIVAGYAYTQVIQIFPALLTAVVAWPQEKLDAMDVQFARVLKSNVGAFLDFDTTSKAVLAVASSIDVFDIWVFVVGSIALSKTTRFSAKGARYVVGGVWLAYILLKVALGGMYSAFMG
jgi:Yip1 domain